MNLKPTYQELEQEVKALREKFALHECDEKFNNYFKNSKVIMLQLDSASKRIIKANQAAINFYGYTHEELLQKSIDDLNTLSVAEINETMKQAVLRKSNFFQFQHVLFNKQIRDVEIYASPVKFGDSLHMMVTVIDITDRLINEKQIKKLSTAVEQSSNSVVITDIEGNIEYTNPKFTKLTGYNAEEAKGQNSRILNSGIIPKKYFKEMWQTILSGQTWKGEFHNKTKSGDFFWERVLITPIKDSEDQIINFLAIKEQFDGFNLIGCLARILATNSAGILFQLIYTLCLLCNPEFSFQQALVLHME